MSEDLRCILNDHECVGVRFFGNKLDFGNLGQGYHNEQDFLTLTGISAGSLEECGAAANFVEDRIGDFLVFVGNNHNCFSPIQTFDHGVGDLGTDKKGE